MESSKNIIKLSKELTKASILLEEYDRYTSLKEVAHLRALTGEYEGKQAVDEALDFISLVSKQINKLEEVCQIRYNLSVDELRAKLSEGHAIISLFDDDLRDYHKIEKSYKMIAAADAFDESGDFSEDSEEAYREGMNQLLARLATLSDDALTIFPPNNLEEVDE